MDNVSVPISQNFTMTVSHGRYLNSLQIIMITICYSFGIFGNLVALVLLCKKSLRSTNAKHNLILKCLSANDLTALLGHLILMCIKLNITYNDQVSLWICRVRVFWRVFGLGSGCVAIVMAVERWLALTKPFVYQKHVTIVLLRRCIYGLWSLAVVLVCMPLIGFGLYYDPTNKERKCVSYKEAKNPLDVAYAYIYFLVGMSLCTVIVFFNIAVMRSLCFKGYTYSSSSSSSSSHNNNTTGRLNNNIKVRRPILIRRVSRSISKMSTASTRDEVAFGRLMGLLCVIFVVCWMPQLLTIPLQQMTSSNKGNYYRIPDMLMAVHFLLDPYIYVVQRSSIFRKLFCHSNNKTSYPQCSTSIRTVLSERTPHLNKV